MRHLQADFVAFFAFGLGGSLKHRQRVFRNAGERLGAVEIKREGVGGIEYVLRKLGGQLGAFGLQRGKLGLLLWRQFGAAQDEIAQIVGEFGLLRRRQDGVFGRVFNRFEARVKFDVLADFGEEHGYFRHQLVVNRAQFGGVGHRVQMGNHAPDAADALGGVGQALDGVEPGGFRLRLNGGNRSAGIGNGALHSGTDVFGADAVETRLAAKVKKGVFHNRSFVK